MGVERDLRHRRVEVQEEQKRTARWGPEKTDPGEDEWHPLEAISEDAFLRGPRLHLRSFQEGTTLDHSMDDTQEARDRGGVH